MRRLIFLLMLGLLLLFGAPSAASAAAAATETGNSAVSPTGITIRDLQATIDSDQSVTVRGVHSAGAGRLVAVQVVDPSGAVVYADAVLSYGLGGFEASFQLPAAAPGTYQVTVNAVGVGTPLTTSFAYGVNNELRSLALSRGGLDKAFAANATEYAVSVDTRVDSIAVTPTVADPTATVQVNGIAVVSGTPSAAITLAEGPNAIAVTVTSLLGETKTYNVVVTKSADLQSTVTAQASIDSSKQVSVAGSSNAGAGQLITVLVTDPEGNPDYAGATLSSGSGEFQLSYSLAQSKNGRYTVIVGSLGQAAPVVTYFDYLELTGLSLSGVTLDPVFSKDTAVYNAAATRGVVQTSVTPTCADSEAVITVNGVPVKNGETATIDFAYYTEVVNLMVTGRDGVASRTYAVTIATGLRPTLTGSGEATIDKHQRVAVAGQVGEQPGQPVALLVTDPVDQPDYADTKLTAATGAFDFAYTTANKTVGAYAVTVGAADMANPIATSFLIAAGDPNLAALTLGGAPLDLGFSPDQTVYQLYVPSGTSAVTLTPTASDPMAVIKVNGVEVESGTVSASIALERGENTVQVVVSTMDGQEKIYTLLIYCYSNAATLRDLFTSDGSLSPSFAPETTVYTATVENSTSLLYLTPTVTDDGASLQVNGNPAQSGQSYGPLLLAPGENTIELLVTSGDKTTEQTYSLTVTRRKSADASLSSLRINQGSLQPSFTPGRPDYDLTVSSTVTALCVLPIANESTATIKVNGNAVQSGVASDPVALKVGLNAIAVQVTAGDGVTTTAYTIFVTRERSKDASLSNLAVSAGSLSPSFERQRVGYAVTVANTVKSLTVTPTVNESTASVQVCGYAVQSGHASSAVNLAVGKNTIPVLVTAGDGVTQVSYTITVTREPSHDASLRGLSVSGYGTLNPAFRADTTSYQLTVWHEISEVTVTPVVNDETARVLVGGFAVESDQASRPILLGLGKNEIRVQVTAGDKVTREIYTLVVTRSLPSSANLSHLLVSSGSLSPAFSPAISGYNLSVENEVSSLTVTAGAEDYLASVRLNNGSSGVGRVSSAVGLSTGRNTILLEVTAQNGAKRTYTIVVDRARSSNAYLSRLTVSAGILTPAFSPNRISYGASVDNGVEKIQIGATTADGGATVTVNGNPVSSSGLSGSIALQVGNNDIQVVVRAENGNTRTYLLTVTRAPSTNANLSRVEYIGYAAGNALINTSIGDFDPAATAYTVHVPNNVTRVRLLPSTEDAWASVKINGQPLPAHAPYYECANLVTGENLVSIVVTAQGGSATKTYQVTLKRAYNLRLASLVINSGSIQLSPPFLQDTTTYTAAVDVGTDQITLRPVAFDQNVAVTVNDTPVTSATPAVSLSLSPGPNPVSVTVTAPDGTSFVYLLTVHKPYSVTYDRNGGETEATPATQAALPGLGVGTLPNQPTREHYDFVGWNSESDGSGAIFTGSTPVAGNITVYAQWTPREYTVTFLQNGGSSVGYPAYRSAEYLDAVSSLPEPDPVREHFWFDGWNTKQDGTGSAFTTGTQVTGSLAVYAQWVRLDYPVSFDLNYAGATDHPASRSIPYGSKLGSLPDPAPTRQHYSFGGWNTQSDGLGDLVDGEMRISGPTTCYAKWVPVNYTVTFDQNGGTSLGYPIARTVPYLGKVAVWPAAPTRAPHYTFGGWFLTSNGTGGEFSGDSQVFGDTTVYAKWNPLPYTVTFNATGGAEIDPETKPYGDPGDLPKTTRNHYRFAGWYGYAGLTGPEIRTYAQVAANITVYAKWTPLDYTVSYELNYDGAGNNPTGKTVTYDQPAGALPLPTRAHHVFAGWYPNPAGSGDAFTASTRVQDDTTIYAKWVARTYTISFHLNYLGAGENPPDLSVIYPANLGALPVPTRAHYTFVRWNTLQNGNGDDYADGSALTADLTVYAQWVARTYTVSFDLNYPGAGENPPDRSVIYPANLGALPRPTRPGYEFAGWNDQPDGGGVGYGDDAALTKNITVFAQWSELYGIAAGDFLGGKVIAAPSSAKPGAIVTLTVQPNAGWRLQAGTLQGTALAGPVVISPVSLGVYSFTMPAGSVTVTAVFEQLHTVTFDQNDGTGETMSITVVSGAVVGSSFPPDPYRENYAFKGWNTARDGSGGTVFAASTPVMDDITVYAQWEPLYAVTLTVTNPAGGAISADHWHDIAAGTTITIDVSANSGYRLKSLRYADAVSSLPIAQEDGRYSFNLPAASVTVTAEFEQYYTVTFDSNGGVCLEPDPITRAATAGQAVDSWLTAPTRDGYRFMGWSTTAGGGTIFTETTPVTGNITVYAEWRKLYGVTVRVLGDPPGGSVSASPTLAIAGTAIQLSVSPGAEMQLESLLYSDHQVTDQPLAEHAFVMPAADVSVTAKFRPLVVAHAIQITASPAGGGSVSASTPKAASGTTVTLQVSPSSGWKLKPGSLQCSDGTVHIPMLGSAFTMPDHEVFVTAEFVQLSADTSLSSLAVGGRLLAPSASDPTAYTIGVPQTATAISVTATPVDGLATLSINELPVGSGVAMNVALRAAPVANVINLVVTAEDGTTKTYKLTVSWQSDDATLRGLVLNLVANGVPEELILNRDLIQQDPPGFVPADREYFADAAAEIASTCSLQIIPTAEEAHAAVAVVVQDEVTLARSELVPVGEVFSLPLPNDSFNLVYTITVTVTAEDGSTLAYSVDLRVMRW